MWDKIELVYSLNKLGKLDNRTTGQFSHATRTAFPGSDVGLETESDNDVLFPKHWKLLAFVISFSLTGAKTLESVGLLSSWCDLSQSQKCYGIFM